MQSDRKQKSSGRVLGSLDNGSGNPDRTAGTSRSRLAAAIRPLFAKQALFEQLEKRTMMSVSAGTLDHTLNPAATPPGVVNISISGANDEATALLIQSNHSIIAVGDSANNGAIELARYLPDGTLDPSFGSSGTVTTSVANGFLQANAAVLDSSGNIYVVGSINVQSSGTIDDIAVAKYGPSGALITSFGSGGIASIDFNQGNDAAYAVAIDPVSGNIVVAGSGSTGATHTARQELAIATLNPTTGANIKKTLTATGSGGQANSIITQTVNGVPEYVVGGYATISGQSHFALAEYSSSLVLDSGFGTGGVVTSSLGSGGAEAAQALAVATDGTLVAAGSAAGDAAVANYSSTGSLLTSYIAPGTSGFAVANGLAIQYDGKIILTGYSNTGPANATEASTFQLETARLTKTGSGSATTLAPDSSFGTGGFVTTAYTASGSAVDAQSNAAAIDAGRLIVAGTAAVGASSTPNEFTVARYQLNSAPTITSSATVSFTPTTELSTTANLPIANGGNLVSSLISQSSLGYGDTDPGALAGIAVTSVDNSNGQWYSSTDGTTWTAITTSSVSTTNALLLTASTYVQFVPNQYFNTNSASTTSGTTPTLGFKAWDQTTGVAGGYYNPTVTNDGYDAFSDNSASASIVVNSVNQPPVVTLASSTLVSVVGVTAPVNGISVSDVDGGSNTETLSISVAAGNVLTLTGTGLTISGTGTNSLTATGTLNALNAALSTGKLTYKATAGTSDSIALSLNDNGNTGGSAQTSSPTSIAVTVEAVPSTVYVNATWAGSTFDQNVGTAPGNVTELYGVNAFATIQSGVNAVASGGTVNVAAGTYVENVTISKPVNLVGANSGIAGATASGTSPTRLSSGESQIVSNGNQSALFTISSSNVTINGFYLEGNAGIAGGTLTSGVNTNVTYAVKATSNYSNLNISNNVIKDVAVGFYGSGTSTGTVINQNWFDSIGVYDFGYAVTLRSNFYANVTNNLMTRVQSGIDTNNFSGAVGPTSWTFSGNTISAYGAGIWDNLQYNQASPLTIDSNTITSLAVPNIAANTVSGATANSNGHTIGILLVSIQDAVSVTITNNTISGMAYGVTLYNTATSNTITLGSTNTISNNGVGVYLTNIVQYNPVTTTVLGGSANNPTAVGTANLTGLTLTGNTVGVLVNSSNAFTADGVTLTLGSGDSIIGGATGLQVTGALSNIAGNSLGTTSFSSQTGNYITLANGALSGKVLEAGAVTFNGSTAAATGLPGDFDTENKVTDYLDDASLGYVELNPGNVYVTQLSDTTNNGAVQRAVNVSSPTSNTNVYLQAGTYVANGATQITGSAVGGAGSEVAELLINKPVTLIGPNTSYNPGSNLTPASAQATIVPALSDSNPYDTTSTIVVYVDSSNVTIEGLTVDGSNSALASHYSDPGTNTYGYGPANPHVGAVTANSATPIDASEDIASYANVSNITIQNDVVENAGLIGVDFNNGTDYSGGATTGNTITKNLIQNISDAYGYGDGINLYDNFYAAVTHNVITNVYTGVQVGNYSQANPDGTLFACISNNAITAGNTGIFYNLSYDAASAFAVNNNSIYAVNNPLYTTWYGVLAATDGASVSFTGNTISGSGANAATQTVGYDVWNTPASTITGGAVSGVQYGVWVNSYEGYDSAGGPSSITLNGASISASTIGLYVEDSSVTYASAFTSTPPAVSAVVEGGTSITATSGGTAVAVSGSQASLSFTNTGAAALSTGTGNFITLSNGAMGSPTTGVIDASNVTFNGLGGGNATTLAGYYGIEDKVTDYLDDSTLGYVKLASGNVYVAHSSEITNAGRCTARRECGGQWRHRQPAGRNLCWQFYCRCDRQRDRRCGGQQADQHRGTQYRLQFLQRGAKHRSSGHHRSRVLRPQSK